jgi:hypothetical protein
MDTKDYWERDERIGGGTAGSCDLRSNVYKQMIMMGLMLLSLFASSPRHQSSSLLSEDVFACLQLSVRAKPTPGNRIISKGRRCDSAASYRCLSDNLHRGLKTRSRRFPDRYEQVLFRSYTSHQSSVGHDVSTRYRQ